MVRQRNLFSNEIDILKDGNEPEERTPARAIVEAFNRGVKVIGVAKSKQKGHSDTPLFREDNQLNLLQP